LNVNSNSNYNTINTALAAFLRTRGFQLLDVMPNDGRAPAVFVFDADPEIKKYEHLWQIAKAEGNLCDFFESYRLCLRMVKVGKL